MNLSHGLSSLHLLVGEETSLIFGTQYSFAFNIVWTRLGDLFSNLIQGFACNCCVDFVWCFTAIYSQYFQVQELCLLSWLSRKIMFETGLLCLQSRFKEKMNVSFSEIPCRPYRYPTEISLLISHHSFWFWKRVKMPVRVADFSSLHVFVE